MLADIGAVTGLDFIGFDLVNLGLAGLGASTDPVDGLGRSVGFGRMKGIDEDDVADEGGTGLLIGTNCPLADKIKAVGWCLSVDPRAALLGETDGEALEAFRLRIFLLVKSELRSRLILFF